MARVSSLASQNFHFGGFIQRYPSSLLMGCVGCSIKSAWAPKSSRDLQRLDLSLRISGHMGGAGKDAKIISPTSPDSSGDLQRIQLLLLSACAEDTYKELEVEMCYY